MESALGFAFAEGKKHFLYQLKSLVLAGRALEDIQPALLGSLMRTSPLLCIFCGML